MSGKRINNPTINQTTFETALINEGEVLVDWVGLIQSKKIPVKLLGNSRWQGSYDNITYSNTVLDDHNFTRLSTDGGTTWLIFKNTNTDLDFIETDGDGSSFLANDGTYKNPTSETDHSALAALDYASSGHTGFAPALGSDDYYVNAAEKGILANTSNTNTGDQTATTVSILDEDELFTAEDVEAALKELRLAVTENIGSAKVIKITLPTGSNVQERINAAVESTEGTNDGDYPFGWVLDTSNPFKDLTITHNLGKSISSVNIFNFSNATDKQLRLGSAAYTGLYDYDSNEIKIQSLATVETKIEIHLIFS